jgi:hypothetical protein
MNKYSLITAIAIVVIITPILYGLWGIYSVEQLQMRTSDSEFSYFEMTNYEKIEICNPLPFFVSFNGIEIQVYYTDDLKGIFEIESTTINPNTSQETDLKFSSDSFSESQYLFMHMDGQFSGEMPARLDANQMIVVTDFETRIIGIIPYHSTITQSAFDFTKMMNEDSMCENQN